MTISILGFDEASNSFGVGGFSHWLALGSINCFIEQSSGLVVSQASLNYDFGTEGALTKKNS